MCTAYLCVSHPQPMVVVSCHGAGRAGCFCAVVLAQQILSSFSSSFIDGWSYDVNILDMVSAS